MLSTLRNVFLVFLATAVIKTQAQNIQSNYAPPAIQHISVDKGVQLEVLDWGGNGRPVVLLAGLGNTAHIFDDFAPKLTGSFHVYGITRRGFGSSSVPASGYSADRLGDDVLAVLDFLKLPRPVLIGHSIAGEELSSIATRRPERISGVIYLDAGYGYAFYSRVQPTLAVDMDELQMHLTTLQNNPTNSKVIHQLMDIDLPLFRKDLQRMQQQKKQFPQSPPSSPSPNSAPQPQPSKPSETDRASFEAFHSWLVHTYGDVIPPVGELRQMFKNTPSGGVGEERSHSIVEHAIGRGKRRYTDIHVPALAIYAAKNDSDRENISQIADAFQHGVPSAKTVLIAPANHYIFLSNEAEVLHDTIMFIDSLK